MFLTALLLSVLSVAAVSFTVSPTSIAFTQPTTSGTNTISITPTINNTNITFSGTSIKYDDGTSFTVSASGSGSNLLNTTSNDVSLSISSTVDYSKLTFGKTYSGNIAAIANSNSSDNQNISVSFAKNFCEGAENSSALKIVSIDDDRDFDWAPLDDSTIEVEVKNLGDEKEKVTVEISFYSESDEELVNIDGSKDYMKQSIRIGDGDTETFTFNYNISADLPEGNYRVYVKAYLDSNESQCVSKIEGTQAYEKASIDYGDSEVVIGDFKTPLSLSCGLSDSVSMNLYNLDYGDDEYFRVHLYNKELGLSLYSDKFNLDNGDSKRVSFDFNVPSNLSARTLKFEATAEYDYSESSDDYGQESDTYTFSVPLENCVMAGASIAAELSADTPNAALGRQVIVEATIRNTGSDSATYNIAISGNSAWSKLADIDPQSFTLGSGESKKVNIYLDINEDAELGDKQFTISARYAGQTTDQKVLLTLEEGLTGGKLAEHLKTYWYIYVIGIITLVLLVIIIALLVRRSA